MYRNTIRCGYIHHAVKGLSRHKFAAIDFYSGTLYQGYFSLVQTDATLLANNSQHCWMLHVASVCTPYCMLLDVVACRCSKFETGQTFQPTTLNISSLKRSATMLDPFAQLFQHCWGHARSLCMDYLWVVFFPRCTAGPNLLGVVASVCTQPYGYT